MLSLLPICLLLSLKLPPAAHRPQAREQRKREREAHVLQTTGRASRWCANVRRMTRRAVRAASCALRLRTDA